MIDHLKHTFLFIFLIFLAHEAAHSQSNFSTAQINEIAQKAEVYESSGNLAEAANCLNKLAYFYWDQKDYPNAISVFKKSLDLNTKIGNKNSLAVINGNLGIIYSDQKDYQMALASFEKSYAIRKEMKDKSGEASQLINIGMTLQSLKNYNGSNEKLELALDIAKEQSKVNLMKNCYQLLAENYDKLGNSTKSFEYFGYFTALDKQDQKKAIQQTKEELNKLAIKSSQEEKLRQQKEQELEAQNQKLMSVEEKLNQEEETIEERSMEIDVLNKDKELKDASIHKKDELIKKELYTIYLAIACSVLLAVLAILSFKNYRDKAKAHQLLHVQSEEIKAQSASLEKALSEIKEKNQKITSSITYAQRIQDAMLPGEEQLQQHFPESFIFFRPRDIVSGDFYWFGTDKNNESDFIVAACDCTGHGVPGAFMSMLGHSILDVINQKGISQTNSILEELHVGIRNALHQATTDNRDGMDVAICKYKKNEKIVEISGAKNGVYFIKDNQLVEIKGDVNAIGGMQKEEVRTFRRHEVHVDQPCTFYLFSDGYPDQFGGDNGKKFMYTKLKDLFLEIHQKPMDEQKLILEKTMDNWKANRHKQIDDMLIIGFKIS